MILRRLIGVLLVAALVQLGAVASGHDHSHGESGVLHAVAVDAHDQAHDHGHHHDSDHYDHRHDDAGDEGGAAGSGFHSHVLVQFMQPSPGSIELPRLVWAVLDQPMTEVGLPSRPSTPPFRPPRG